MSQKIWHKVKVNGETVAKVKSYSLAFIVKQQFEKIYKEKTVTIE